ncbi:NAD(P)-binding protein [Mycena maculata]|uniref:NAD(P)-binding protein n=1 Tax=Mycena maculata TaxID=230809 RepID=A0AAD7JB94_9AGAR|nr:NAD(P)-binding protein [Mycena maculata]
MPIVSIFGATGLQGSAVLKAVLEDGTFTPRAVSRNPDSDAAKALKAQGVEVVKGDLFDLASIKEALKGSDVVFGVTNFWDPSVFPGTTNGEGEIQQGKNLVDAATAVGIKFFVWSGLPSSKVLSKGKFSKVYHIDNKATIYQYLESSGLDYAAVETAYFADNLWRNGALKKTATGYTIPIPKYSPTSTQTFTWVAHDLGPAVLALLKNYDNPAKIVLRKSFPVVTAIETYPQIARRIAAAIKQEVTFISTETAGLAELDEMYAYQSACGMYKDTPVPNPDLVLLGVKIGTLDELISTEIVPRFS